MATATFGPTQLTYRSRSLVNRFNFCVFHQILIRFGLKMERVLDNYGYSLTYWTNKLKPTNSESFYLLCLSMDEICYSYLATILLLSCSCSAPTLLLPGSSFCPAPAVLLPCSIQAPIRHIPSSSPVPAQLHSFCPVLLYSAQLYTGLVPALVLSPLML